MTDCKDGYTVSTVALPDTDPPIYETMVFLKGRWDEQFCNRGDDEFESHLEGLVWVYEHGERITAQE